MTRRLRERYPPDRILTLYGAGAPDGMSEPDREAVKAAFNDPESRVRVLVATDAASEGLNLQRTARYLLHYDLPWNPSRLEQRNGRLDRYGQGRDVTVHYFLGQHQSGSPLPRPRRSEGGRNPRRPGFRQRGVRPCGAPPPDPGRSLKPR